MNYNTMYILNWVCLPIRTIIITILLILDIVGIRLYRATYTREHSYLCKMAGEDLDLYLFRRCTLGPSLLPRLENQEEEEPCIYPLQVLATMMHTHPCNVYVIMFTPIELHNYARMDNN